jgi:pimeloyl-ACP methyl ester carboxylesterase
VAVKAAKELIALTGMKIEVERRGRGAPLMLLYSEEALELQAPLVDELAETHELLIVSPPGFGASERPLWLTDPNDLAFACLELADRLKLRDATVLGFSLGGWIAAEMAAMDDAFISKLVLVAPYGIKLGGPTDRDIADIWLTHPDRVQAMKWHDPKRGAQNFEAMRDEALAIIARNQETTARFCWRPYMHNPKLAHRLQRISVPTLLVWGESDCIVTPAYGRGYAGLIPGARLEVIPSAGHFPHLEEPRRFMAVLKAFIG